MIDLRLSPLGSPLVRQLGIPARRLIRVPVPLPGIDSTFSGAVPLASGPSSVVAATHTIGGTDFDGLTWTQVNTEVMNVVWIPTSPVVAASPGLPVTISYWQRCTVTGTAHKMQLRAVGSTTHYWNGTAWQTGAAEPNLPGATATGTWQRVTVELASLPAGTTSLTLFSYRTRGAFTLDLARLSVYQ